MLRLAGCLVFCLSSSLWALPDPETKAYLGDLKAFGKEYKELRKRAAEAFAAGTPVSTALTEEQLKAWEGSLPKTPAARRFDESATPPSDPEARKKHDKAREEALAIKAAENTLLPQSDPVVGRLAGPLDGPGAVAQLRELWVQAVCVQQGRAPEEDAEIFRTAIVVLAPKLETQPEKAVELYGSRSRQGACAAGSGQTGSKEAQEAETVLRAQAVDQMLRRSDVSEGRRTELEGRAKGYASALGGLVFIDAQGNTQVVGRTNGKPMTEAERARLARLPTIQFPEAFKTASAEPPPPAIFGDAPVDPVSATAQAEMPKVRYWPNELKDVKLKAWDAVVVTQHSGNPDHSGVVVAMPQGDRIVYARMDGRPGKDFPKPPWAATSKDPIHTFDTLEEAVKYGYANSDAVILPSKRLSNGMMSGEAMVEYRKSGKDEWHPAKWCSTYTKDLMKAGGYDAGFAAGITPGWIASNAEGLVQRDPQLVRRAQASFTYPRL